MNKQEDFDLYYLPENVYGVSYLVNPARNRHCLREGDLCSLEPCSPNLVYSTTSNIQQGIAGMRLNKARLERRPFFRYIYGEDKAKRVFYQEELPWLDWNEVYGPNSVINISLKIQIRLAIRWAVSQGIYNLEGVKVMVVPSDYVLNLSDRTIRTYGYIPIFTDFVRFRETGTLENELLRFALTKEEENLAKKMIVFPAITAEDRDKYSSSSLMYPLNISSTPPESSYLFLGQSYFSQAYEAYVNYRQVTDPKEKLAYLIVAKEYARQALLLNTNQSVLYPTRETRGAYEVPNPPQVNIGNKTVYQSQVDFLNYILSIKEPEFQVLLSRVTKASPRTTSR